MGRKGQIFYLYNRVKTIMEKKMWLSAIVPEARIGVAHGQMSERELEDTMADFLNGEYDVLLCTTIIESGLDMPNVNTVIVEDGDKLEMCIRDSKGIRRTGDRSRKRRQFQKAGF